MTYLLHRLVTEAAEAGPDREAVRFRDRSLSYGELEGASNGVARALLDAGVQRGDRVAIWLSKRVEAVAAIYGAMKAGAAYVPLDPQAPVARAAMVASDCAVSAVVSTPARAASLVSALRSPPPRLAVLVEDGSEPGEVAVPSLSYAEASSDAGASDPGVPVIEQDLAYILYTSGSTGTPKGVMLSHRNALSFVEWCASSIGVGPEDRLSNHAPMHFDLSVFDLYLAAMGRVPVVLVPEEEAYFGTALRNLIVRQRLTVWYSVPSALMLLAKAVADPGDLSTLRAVVFAGEVYPTGQLRELRRVVPSASLWNLYGPTETNVITYHRVGELPEDDRTIPIGRACENTEVFALTPEGAVAGVGEEGELYARGPTVMKGYWGDPERTARGLVPNPLNPNHPDPCYRTGDIVRLRDDGEYDFLGRRDHQIKSRGYRVELGDIEAALNAHPGLDHAAAVAVPHEEWGKAVVAFVVPRPGHEVTEREVKRHVSQLLPRYMVPWKVRLREDLPRTSTGKIDRPQLLLAAEEAPDGGAAQGDEGRHRGGG